MNSIKTTPNGVIAFDIFNVKPNLAVSKQEVDISTIREIYQSGNYSAFRQEWRRAGSLGAYFAKIEQKPHDFVDQATHEYQFQLITRLEGSSQYHLGDKWIDASDSTGKIVLTPPDAAVSYRVNCEHDLLLAVLPQAKLAEALGLDVSEVSAKFNKFYARPFRDPTIFALVQRMWSASQLNDSASALFIDSAAVAMVALVQGQAESHSKIEQKSKLSKKTLDRVEDYISAHLNSSMTLGDLAAVACMSSFHFSRCFKATTGKTPLTYVMEERIEWAKTLLLIGDMPIAHVAYTCGFANQAHFTTTFRKHVGMTPGQFKA